MLVHALTQPGQTINEDSPIDPRWAYPQSKVETEALIREKRGNVPVVLLRLAGVYDDHCHSAFLSQQIARIYERQLFSHLYPGDIHRGQASVHLDDVTGLVARLIEKRRELPKELTLLVGEPETLSYDEIQRLAGRLIHSEEWETREIPKSLAKTGDWIEDEILDEEPFIKPWMVDMADNHYAIDITRARLLFAPLFFWTASAAAYTNDTVIGALAIIFSVLVPMMPGMSHEGMMDESTVPPGRTYSPSSRLQRLPKIALGFFGFLLARYLTASQLGHVGGVGEPFFFGGGGKNGTEFIITSAVSRAWL